MNRLPLVLLGAALLAGCDALTGPDSAAGTAAHADGDVPDADAPGGFGMGGGSRDGFGMGSGGRDGNGTLGSGNRDGDTDPNGGGTLGSGTLGDAPGDDAPDGGGSHGSGGRSVMGTGA